MTKRFILNEGVANFSDIVTDKVYSEYNLDEIVELLNELAEEKEELESFKKLVYLVLKKEYDLRMNEMSIFAKKEDWQGYRATKLERGTVQRIAKRLGVDLE